jgi:hypothetical protein
VCVPVTSVDVLKVATPELRVPVPRVFVPSLKVTTPVGVVPLPVIATENTTAVPAMEGFGFEVRTDVVVGNTDRMTLFEVLELSSVSPP